MRSIRLLDIDMWNSEGHRKTVESAQAWRMCAMKRSNRRRKLSETYRLLWVYRWKTIAY